MYSLGLLTGLATVGGFFTLMGGVALFPSELTTEERIDPDTHAPYSLEIQHKLYRQKVLASHGFRLIIIGASITVAGILIMYSIWLYARRTIVAPESSPVAP
jgi:hypothetical protein